QNLGGPFAGEFILSGGSIVTDRLYIRAEARLTMTGGSLTVNNELRLDNQLSTLDLTGAAVTVNFGANCFADFHGGTLIGATHSTFIAGPGSLLNFAAGFDPYTQIGQINTQGIIHIAGPPLNIAPN